MTFGLNESDYEMFLQLVVNPLKNLGADLFIFGSRATGVHHPFSDLDLLIVPPKDAAKVERSLSSIKEAIEECRFPVKVDFVLIDNLAASFREKVLREKIQI